MSVLPKFLENATTSTIAMGTVASAAGGYVADLFKEEKVLFSTAVENKSTSMHGECSCEEYDRSNGVCQHTGYGR